VRKGNAQEIDRQQRRRNVGLQEYQETARDEGDANSDSQMGAPRRDPRVMAAITDAKVIARRHALRASR